MNGNCISGDGLSTIARKRFRTLVFARQARGVQMTWIKTVPLTEADESLRSEYEAIYSLYPPEYAQDIPLLKGPDGSADSIVAAHSLIPGVMRDMMSAYGRLLSSKLPLSRRQHEMIATVVSVSNRCFY